MHLLAILLLAGLFTCNNLYAAENDDLDHALQRLIRIHDLVPDPDKQPDIPDINSPKAQLGMRLFFSRNLSGSQDTACASCHHPLLGGGDGLSLSIGTGVAEPEQTGLQRHLKNQQAPLVPRNALTTFNAAAWQWNLFHDGRVELLLDGKSKLNTSPYNNKMLGGNGITTPDVAYPRDDHWAGENLVQAQTRFPLVLQEEMRGGDFSPGVANSAYRSKLAQRLGGYGQEAGTLPQSVTRYWQEAFRKAYQADQNTVPSALVTGQNITELLSTYVRSQWFTNNPWRRYLQGVPNAISPAAKRGALLFYRQPGSGGFGCVNCHRGSALTDEDFHNMLMPPIGVGKQADGEDWGRGAITGKIQDRYRFRTPSLLNIAVTGPWGHNGAYTTLEGMVRHMLDPRKNAASYAAKQIQQANIQTENTADNVQKMLAANPALPAYAYTEGQVRQLVAFLQTLTDPCVQDAECLQAWIPPDTEPDLLRFRIHVPSTD